MKVMIESFLLVLHVIMLILRGVRVVHKVSINCLYDLNGLCIVLSPFVWFYWREILFFQCQQLILWMQLRVHSLIIEILCRGAVPI